MKEGVKGKERAQRRKVKEEKGEMKWKERGKRRDT